MLTDISINISLRLIFACFFSLFTSDCTDEQETSTPLVGLHAPKKQIVTVNIDKLLS